MASEEVRGSFCRYDSWVITDQLATGAGALERELLTVHRRQVRDPPWLRFTAINLVKSIFFSVAYDS